MKPIALAVLLASLICPALVHAGEPVTLESLLKEMTDREAIARFPDPAYTCKQFSSYDRRSTTPDDPKTWFANGDVNQYLRVEEVSIGVADGLNGSHPITRKEWVMADMDGPGAVVRIWSANPAGTLRIYLDGDAKPVIEAPMGDLLGGKWRVGPPLSQECSKGWNLYLPMPYAKHCKITSDKDGFYYQVDYRTYDKSTAVQTLSDSSLRDRAAIDAAGQTLMKERPLWRFSVDRGADWKGLGPGESTELMLVNDGAKSLPESTAPIRFPGAVKHVFLFIEGPVTEQDLRSVVITGEFDGEQTIWAPVSDFFGVGVGASTTLQDWYRSASKGGLSCDWVMPFRSSMKIGLTNLGNQSVPVWGAAVVSDWSWDSRSMHFHANWHYEYPIHAYGGRGTKDWNYIDIQGKGVYAGDTLAVMNPVPQWWGEGDEKIYVDGEKFPSHFGTGTEDYYGYAWCWPVKFEHPFHAQPRVDGNGKNNWGHTTVTRVRSLDAIPFTKSFKFDMEIWHWKECDEAYAATTYWYALPGAASNRKPQPEDAAKPIPQPPPLPPPFHIKDAIECESMKVVGRTPGITIAGQDMDSFGHDQWSGNAHLWVQADKPGQFVELAIPAQKMGPCKVTLYATKSWDYGTVQFSVNGKKAGQPIDLFSGEHGKCLPSGPIDLGVFEPADGKLTLRAEVVGANAKAEGTKSFFGLDCVVLTPP